MAPPNSGPKLREIIKYGPPAGTTPLVAIALILMAVNIVCEAKGTNNQPSHHPNGTNIRISITSQQRKHPAQENRVKNDKRENRKRVKWVQRERKHTSNPILIRVSFLGTQKIPHTTLWEPWSEELIFNFRILFFHLIRHLFGSASLYSDSLFCLSFQRE